MFALSWSVKALGVVLFVFGFVPVSLIPGVTLRNEPSAVEMRPDDTWATKSLVPPPPTVLGLVSSTRGQREGYNGGAVHGTSCHSVLGYETLKHPSPAEETAPWIPAKPSDYRAARAPVRGPAP